MFLSPEPAGPRPGYGGCGHWGGGAAEALWGCKPTGVLKETVGPGAPTGLAADPRPSLTNSGSCVGTFTQCENKSPTSCT